MKHILATLTPKSLLALISLIAALTLTSAAPAATLRRPVSPTTPMYLMQVDLTVGEDPQGAINTVPSDIKPYVVMMMCPSGTSTTGPADADNFCNICLANGMWAMVQVSSGVTNTFSDTDTSGYEALFQKYPNLIGFCFAEQNWGFDSTTFATRLTLFANLLPLANQYGGYLYINEMQSYSNRSWNTVSKFKTSQAFADATATYKNNFILGSKFTMGAAFYDNESGCLGAWLSGHAGNYAVRYDAYSWSYTGRSQVFGAETPGTHVNNSLAWFSAPEPVMGIPIVDHVMLQGAAVIDGPEIAWVSELYKGKTTPVFPNMIADIFRKVLDKTIKIPSYSEVLAKTPIAYVSDQSNIVTGGLYDGLYQIDGDAGSNYTWFKKTGRYSSIPELYTSNSRETSHFTTYVLQSQYSTRWPTLQDKINEFNGYFSSPSSGASFVARRDNRLFVYNPNINTNVDTTASIPLQYNTCSNATLKFPAHTFAAVVENNSSLQIYLNNYRTDKDPLWQQYGSAGMNRTQVQAYIVDTFIPTPPDDTAACIRTSTIQVSGCTNTPTYSFADRGDHPASVVSSSFSGGVFTLTVKGNGPADITINCAGSASRPAVPAGYTMTPPPAATTPSVPTGLTATTVSSTQIDLDWGNVSGATSYTVLRSTTSGGPYSTRASGVTASSFSDTGLTAATTYYYVVSAVNSFGTSGNSAQASATTASATAVAHSISINFVGGGTAMASSESAGVVAKTNWNNAANASGSGMALKDLQGSNTPVTLTWASDHTSLSTITDTAGNYRMMRGMLNTSNTSTSTITVAGLIGNANGYDVYIYCQPSQPSTATRTAAYQISGSGITTTTVNATASTPNFTGTFTQANNSTGNYVKFTIGNVSGFTIKATPVSASDGTPRAPVNGIQIIAK